MTEQDPQATFQADQDAAKAEEATREEAAYQAHLARSHADTNQVDSWAARNLMAAHMWKAIGDLLHAVRLGVLVIALCYGVSLILGVFL